MRYEEYEVYTHFDEREDNLIQMWLYDHEYAYNTNTVCGGCCGMYADEYWVNGIGGEWREGDEEKFKEFAKENRIPCEVEGYTIRATEE